MRIAILPTRGGSKRIKDKNIAPFCGQPMISYPLAAAKESKLFDIIHVSTDSDKIRAAAESLGFPVDFPRDAVLSDDKTPLVPVLKWVVEQYAERGKKIDDVCLIMPCAPLIDASDLRGGFDVYEKHNRRRSVLTVASYPAPTEWAFTCAEDGVLTPCEPGKFKIRSQDLRTKYYDTATFSIFNAELILRGEALTDTNFAAYLLPKEKSVDIDEAADWRLAEALYRGTRPS